MKIQGLKAIISWFQYLGHSPAPCAPCAWHIPGHRCPMPPCSPGTHLPVAAQPRSQTVQQEQHCHILTFWLCTGNSLLCQDSHHGSLRAEQLSALPDLAPIRTAPPAARPSTEELCHGGVGRQQWCLGGSPGDQLQVTALDLLPQKVLCATWPPPAGPGHHGWCQVATFWILTLLEFAPGRGDTPVHKVPISVKADVSTLLAELSSREACS